MKVKNATTLPKIYYGLHMVEGVAEYQEPNSQPYRIMIGEDAIKNMDPTFSGRPVYVRHVDEVDLSNLQAEADGYVIESFFNKADGKHWAKFIVVSDKGHQAIQNGWKLSNAYIPKMMGGGGLWHGVEYAKEVTRGEYEHLAIVPNPRYEESIILTPEDFKKYNGEKELELIKFANAKEKGEGVLNLFKKTKVDNAADFEAMSVILPKSKKETTIAKLVNDMDDMEMNADKPMMANGEHHVMVGDEKMTVNDLVAKHMEMCAAAPKDNAEDDEAKKKALELAAHEEKEMAEKKANEEKEMKEKKENEEKAAKEKKENDKKNFDALKNAHVTAGAAPAPRLELSEDRVARGKQRYGKN